jgi:chaperonin GroEL
MVGGVAIINVGGGTEIEMKEKKDRLDDALQATKAALEEGILPGAGTALLSARIAISNKDNTDFGRGGKIVYDACVTPFDQILKNAGENIYKWLIELNEVDTNYVPNINEGVVVDAYDSGIIDPTKVVRCALENAAAAAVTLLMTECVIHEKQDNKKSKDNEVDMSQFGI